MRTAGVALGVVEKAAEAALASAAAHAAAASALSSAVASWASVERCEMRSLNALPQTSGGTPSRARTASTSALAELVRRVGAFFALEARVADAQAPCLRTLSSRRCGASV